MRSSEIKKVDSQIYDVNKTSTRKRTLVIYKLLFMAYNSWRSSMWIWNAKWNEGKHIVTVLLKNHQASPLMNIFPFSRSFYNFIVGCWLLRLNGQLNKITLGILETAVVEFFIYDFSPPHILTAFHFLFNGCWMTTKEELFSSRPP